MDVQKISFRPIPFYFINTTDIEALSRASIFGSMHQLKLAGFGGCIVFNKPPDGFSQEEYLTDRWFELIKYFAEAGRELKLQIWVNDGYNFPPGDAGGRIQKIAPYLKQKMMFLNDSGEIEIVETDWGFPAFEEPESSELFIELVYEEYKRRLGNYFGKGITGFFSDADNRRFGPVAGENLENMKSYYPFCGNFFKIFKEEYGYDLKPFLKDILVGNPCAAAKDYWELSGKLYANWFKKNYEWCHENKLKYAFHTSDTGPFSPEECKRSSIFTEGSFQHLARFSDFPGTDHELLALNGGKHFSGKYFIPQATWGGDNTHVLDDSFYKTSMDVRAKYASSAAFLYGKERVLCEAFAATNWGVDFCELRKIASWQIMQGINFFVPHAVHHKLHGKTKFFAPPDFSKNSHLNSGIKEFNDWLSETCMYASMGKLTAPIALLDPTRQIWSGKSESKSFFKACAQLNYLPYGYVIVNEEDFIEHMNKFQVLINPGLEIDTSLKDLFLEIGGKIIGHEELKKLDEILECNIDFNGNGKLQYMRRFLGGDDEMLLVGNIDNSDIISGDLLYKGEKYYIELYPGEISIINSGKILPEKPSLSREILKLPDEWNVSWGSKNIIPLSRWENTNGEPVSIDSNSESLFFIWENTEELDALDLMIPDNFLSKDIKLLLDGSTLFFSSDILHKKPLEDNYVKLALSSAKNSGQHQIEIRKKKGVLISNFNSLYLSGEFNVRLETSNDFKTLLQEYYSMELYLPTKAQISLSKRAKKLRAFSWTKQGHPFYSGEATYSLNINLPDKFAGGKLYFPEIKSICSVKINGEFIARKIFPPYEFELPAIKGACLLEVTISNTLANMLEGYQAPSGILSRPIIKGKVN